jgi:hypothetical protein
MNNRHASTSNNQIVHQPQPPMSTRQPVAREGNPDRHAHYNNTQESWNTTSRSHANASPPRLPRKRQREWVDDVGFQGAVDNATGHPNQRRQQHTSRYLTPVNYDHNSDDHDDGGSQADSGHFVSESRQGTSFVATSSHRPLDIPFSSNNRQYHPSLQPQVSPYSQLRQQSNNPQRSANYGGAGDPRGPMAGPSRYGGHLQQPEYAIMEDDEMGESEDLPGLREEWDYDEGYNTIADDGQFYR